jgi:dolichyl-phosphate-mannose-protein mannosyltransferase
MPRPPVAAREWCLIGALTAVAVLLRAWSLHSTGLVQYDEGVYAFSGLGIIDASQPFRTYPEQVKFSPPFHIGMVALSYLAGGISDRSVVMLNVLLGTLTVPVLWLIGRRWFGPAAGAAAATLLAFGPTHLTLSRSGLTDIAFALNFLIAVFALVWALEEGGNWRAVVAGFATGLAWNTKYHGWFAGAIAIGAVIVMHYRERRIEDTRRRIRTLVISGTVAVVCYLPWTAYIQTQPGSTEGWSRYFATMLRFDWFGNFWRHVQQQEFLEIPFSRFAIPMSLVAATIAHHGPVRPHVRRVVVMVVLAFVAALAFGSFGAACLATIAVIPSMVRRGRVVDWVLMGWLALWVVMAPVYHPYFRLLLPFCIATYLGAGYWLEAQLSADTSGSVANRASLLSLSLSAAALVLLAAPRVRPNQADPWSRGDALRVAAESLTTHIPEGSRVTVVGEPTLAFYLHRLGRPAFESPKPEDIDSMQSTGYLITGVYTNRAKVLRTAVDGRRADLDSVTTVHVEPNDLRLLDDSRPGAARRYRSAPDSTFDLTLFRFRGRAGR